MENDDVSQLSVSESQNNRPRQTPCGKSKAWFKRRILHAPNQILSRLELTRSVDLI